MESGDWKAVERHSASLTLGRFSDGGLPALETWISATSGRRISTEETASCISTTRVLGVGVSKRPFKPFVKDCRAQPSPLDPPRSIFTNGSHAALIGAIYANTRTPRPEKASPSAL